MKTEKGDILKNRLTGEFYKVKNIAIEKVILESENTPNKVWYGDKECLDLLYEEVEDQGE